MKKNLFKSSAVLLSGVVLLGVGSLAPTQKVDAAARSYITVVKKSKVYNRKGHFTGKYIHVGNPETKYGTVTIKGKKYYKISGNRYIRAVNAKSGKKVVLKHLANVYDKNGKINHDFKMAKGTKMTVKSFITINGHRYYKIGKDQYIKATDFQIIGNYAPVISNNNTTSNASNNTNVLNTNNSNTSASSNISSNGTTASTIQPVINNGSQNQTSGNTQVQPTIPVQPTTPAQDHNNNAGTTIKPNQGSQTKPVNPTQPTTPTQNHDNAGTTTKPNQGSQTKPSGNAGASVSGDTTTIDTPTTKPSKPNQGSQTKPSGNAGASVSGDTTTIDTPSNPNQGSQTKPNKDTDQNTFRLPANYRVGIDSNQWEAQSEKGNAMNNYKANLADQNQAVNPDKLTSSQQQELSEFAQNIYNSERSQLGLNNVEYNAKTQELANRIADNYRKQNWDAFDNLHYVKGIAEAQKSMGIDSNVNSVEDIYVESGSAQNMNDLKELTYNGIKSFFFISSEQEHAKDMVNPSLKSMAVSISTQDNGSDIAMHLITVSSKYNF
ncbi:SEC10/PgrA surface exclusion domain-containing protein [Lactobacillus crispatus]|uniref:SEC10/PgrA surface exclusion domain-containing protein n=1 Tax=Lactobacillus crispatus TaxID=47770 RepID=UPI001CC67C7D|nr:SEC10/PgrA surface exclusion domain-containing protein [Lactobacillus crispatus]UAY40606.1 SEC10/PgrA surface exclusion domain-containing protein [Lactobacillus crispatus]